MMSVFLFSVANKFSEKKFIKKVGSDAKLFLFLWCYKFNTLMFSHIFHSFSKNCIIHQPKNVFLNY